MTLIVDADGKLRLRYVAVVSPRISHWIHDWHESLMNMHNRPDCVAYIS